MKKSKKKRKSYKDLGDVRGYGGNRGETQVWYARSSDTLVQAALGMGKSDLLGGVIAEIPTKYTIRDTHVLLGRVPETNPEKVFEMFQAENWSPRGEANEMIRRLGVNHLSMTVGDVVSVNGVFYVVDLFGFRSEPQSVLYLRGLQDEKEE